MSEIRIRAARQEDGPSLAILSAQLGYPEPPEAIASRLRGILRRPEHAVLVAEDGEGCLRGWVHIFIRPLLILGPHAEIGGLVVDEKSRGEGIGGGLLKAAESWARAKHLEAVLVRSRETRHQAHAFYEALGYERIKLSYTFRRSLK